MALNLFNSAAQIDIAEIDPDEVSKLDDNAQAKLASLISAVHARESATDRMLAAQAAVIDCTQEQIEALAEHIKANSPPDAIDALRENQRSYIATH
jgi:predicted nuclease with RNAse H fold